MNNLRVIMAVLLAVLVFTATVSDSAEEMGKGDVTISLKCNTKTECLKNIACEACVDCRCDSGTCKCHGFTAETNKPTV
ncbi:hypothetical protein ISN45_Aa01g005730 [Arabidopsis thaliana x Arabidopsis arenosa]|uniref:Uncharacterized protein n=1 Tax=Arabidopsis thaliana x Arabidopsis arenosa TaxID=1240361 RepID=A0A8T2C0R9_9BRAS|nr:hypothetical protein ISN45_Aa01g005730 [Arabidopsis thaliana x Arabidopsis arenosa]